MACIKNGQDRAFLAYLARQVGVQEIHERIVLPTVAPQNKLLVSHVHPMDRSFMKFRLLSSWNSPGKNTGAGCHFLLQGIFLTQGSNPGLLHCRWILSFPESPGKPQNKSQGLSYDLQSPTLSAFLYFHVFLSLQIISTNHPTLVILGSMLFLTHTRYSPAQNSWTYCWSAWNAFSPRCFQELAQMLRS